MLKVLVFSSLIFLFGGLTEGRPPLPQLPSNDVNEVQFDDPTSLLDIPPVLQKDVENAKNKLLTILTSLLPHSIYLEPPTFGMSNISFPFENLTTINLTRLQLTIDIQPKYLKVVPDLRLLTLGFEYVDASINIVGNYRTMNNDFTLIPINGKGLINITLSDVKVSGTAKLTVQNNALYVQHCDVKYQLSSYRVEQKYKDMNRVVRSQLMDTHAFKLFLPGLIREDVTDLLRELTRAQLNSILTDIRLPFLFQGNHKAVQSFSLYSQNVVPYFNEILDEILENLGVQLHNRGLDTHNIPDFNKSVSVKESVFHFNLSISVHNGTFKNISTVYRTSDAALGRNGTKLFLTGGVGFHVFQIDYEHYVAKIMGVSSEGSLTASVRNTSVLFKITLEVNHQVCYPSLEYVHVNMFDGLQLDITGSESFKLLVKPVALWAFERYRNEIITKIDEELETLAHTYLKPFDCSKYFPPSIA